MLKSDTFFNPVQWTCSKTVILCHKLFKMLSLLYLKQMVGVKTSYKWLNSLIQLKYSLISLFISAHNFSSLIWNHKDVNAVNINMRSSSLLLWDFIYSACRNVGRNTQKRSYNIIPVPFKLDFVTWWDTVHFDFWMLCINSGNLDWILQFSPVLFQFCLKDAAVMCNVFISCIITHYGVLLQFIRVHLLN